MSFHSHSDFELLDLLGQGYDEAFTEIYNRYWKLMLSVAANKTGDLDEAEEIVQDIFVSLWNRRSELIINTSLNSYLAVSVKYKVMKVLSARNMRMALDDHDMLTQPFLGHSTEHELEFDELQTQLADLVSNLPEKCRLVYKLSRDAGYTHKQISDEMNISEKTVEAHISRALRAIRQGLGHFVFFLLF